MNTVQYVPTIAPYLVYAWGAFVAQFNPTALSKKARLVSWPRYCGFIPSSAGFLPLSRVIPRVTKHKATVLRYYMHIFCVWFGNRLFAVRTSDSYQDSAGSGSRRLKKLKYLLCCSTLKKLSCLTLDPHGTWIRIFIRQ